jgi:hypothetical protein
MAGLEKTNRKNIRQFSIYDDSIFPSKIESSISTVL